MNVKTPIMGTVEIASVARLLNLNLNLNLNSSHHSRHQPSHPCPFRIPILVADAESLSLEERREIGFVGSVAITTTASAKPVSVAK